MATKLHQHFKIFKPYGMLSQFASNSSQQKKKRFLGDIGAFPEGTMPIGRLDEASEGLLLLTTDGKMSNFVNSNKIEKQYYVQVDGIITNTAIKKLQNGVEIGFDSKKYNTKPCNVFKLEAQPIFPERSKKIRDDRHGSTSWVSITLKEGKFRQVRKMTSAVNYPTLRLIRVRVGTIKLGTLKVEQFEKVNLDVLKTTKNKI